MWRAFGRYRAILSRRFYQSARSSSSGALPKLTPLLAYSLFNAVENDDDLYQCIAKQNYGEVYRKIRHGENASQQHKYGWTPLILASAWNDQKVVKLLLEHGADPDGQEKFVKPNPTQLTRRIGEAMYSDEDEIKIKARETLFPDTFDIRADMRGATALFYAVLNSNVEMVKMLLEHGADPLIKTRSGYHPLEVVDDSLPTGQHIKGLLIKAIKSRDQMMKERRKKYPLEARLKEAIIGQDSAIKQVSATIRRKENGWVDKDHPIVLIFLGSSGIGKTELAKQIAKYIHGENKDGFVRIDMSEYSSQHEVSRLIGAPPGYIGHDKGGQLTESLTKCSDAVVLFDEIEKAHPDALPILLQLFDEGRMTDGQGKTVECKDAIFIMTSNLASSQIAEYGVSLRSHGEQKNVVDKSFKRNVVKPILKFHFKRDEFLGRINEFVYFLPFSDSELHQLVEHELNIWKNISKEKHDMHLSWEDSIIAVLADGYDLSYGARSVKYETERKVVTTLASGKLKLHIKPSIPVTSCE